MENNEAELLRIKNLKDRFKKLDRESFNNLHPSFCNPAKLLEHILKDENADELVLELESENERILKERSEYVSPKDKIKVDIESMSNPSRAELRDMIERIANEL